MSLESREHKITIVEDVAAGKIIVRIILLAATMRKDPRSIWLQRTIPRNFNLQHCRCRREEDPVVEGRTED
jgi:hypothetical protein